MGHHEIILITDDIFEMFYMIAPNIFNYLWEFDLVFRQVTCAITWWKTTCPLTQTGQLDQVCTNGRSFLQLKWFPTGSYSGYGPTVNKSNSLWKNYSFRLLSFGWTLNQSS